MYQIIANANFLFLFFFLLSLSACSVIRIRKEYRTVSSVIFSITLVLIPLSFFLYLWNIFLPIRPLFSRILAFILLSGSVFFIIKNLKNVKDFFTPVKKNAFIFFLSLLFFNGMVAVTNYPSFRYNIPLSVANICDAYAHEMLIHSQLEKSTFSLSCAEKTNDLSTIYACESQYSHASHTLIAFLHTISPFSLPLKINYASILFSITSTSIFSLGLTNPILLILILPIFFHPVFHMIISYDYVAQIVSLIFLTPLIIIPIASNGLWIFFLWTGVLLGSVLTYPPILIAVFPFFLWYFMPFLIQKLKKKEKTILILFFGMFLLTGVIGFYFVTTLVPDIIKETNPGRVNFIQTNLLDIVGLTFIKNIYYENNYMLSYFEVVCVSGYMALFFLFLFRVLKKIQNLGRIFILQTTILIIFFISGKQYWIIKFVFYWWFFLIVCIATFVASGKKIKKKESGIVITLFSLVVAAIWIRGVVKNYYNTAYRGRYSLFVFQRLSEIQTVTHAIPQNKKTLVLINNLFNTLISFSQPKKAQYFSQNKYVLDKSYQYKPMEENYFISNFDLREIDTLIIHKRASNVETIPSLFKLQKKAGDIYIYKKTISSFKQILFPYNESPFYVKNESVLKTYLQYRGRLIIKFKLRNHSKIQEFRGESYSFLETVRESYPFYVVNAYELL